jgi:AmmeMemoRadiSam system protein A
MRCHVAFVLLAAILAGCSSGEILKKEIVVKEHKSSEWSPELSDSEKETLFQIANDSLDWGVDGAKTEFDFSKYSITDKLKVDTATFVTLKMDGQLRGCIGSLVPVDTLYLSVHHNALNASLRDPRFRPVDAQERAQLEVHISILSPIVPIDEITQFHLGEHGIILEKGANRSVYLPEVAVEQKWSMAQTLSSLSEKAGLPPDGWKEGATFSVFSSVVLLLD